MALAESIKFAHMADPQQTNDRVADRVLATFSEAVTTGMPAAGGR